MVTDEEHWTKLIDEVHSQGRVIGSIALDEMQYIKKGWYSIYLFFSNGGGGRAFTEGFI